MYPASYPASQIGILSGSHPGLSSATMNTVKSQLLREVAPYKSMYLDYINGGMNRGTRRNYACAEPILEVMYGILETQNRSFGLQTGAYEYEARAKSAFYRAANTLGFFFPGTNNSTVPKVDTACCPLTDIWLGDLKYKMFPSAPPSCGGTNQVGTPPSSPVAPPRPQAAAQGFPDPGSSPALEASAQGFTANATFTPGTDAAANTRGEAAAIAAIRAAANAANLSKKNADILIKRMIDAIAKRDSNKKRTTRLTGNKGPGKKDLTPLKGS